MRLLSTLVLLITCLVAAPAHSADDTTASNSVIFGGGFDKPFTLTASELAALPHELITVPVHGKLARFEGVRLLEFLRRAGAPLDEDLRGPHLTKFLLVTAADGYRAVFSLAELDEGFGHAPVYLVDMRDNAPLDAKEGPFRLVVGDEKRGGRGVRQVTRVDLVDAVPR